MTYNYKNIWLISYPILIGLVIQQLIGLTDTAFLGRVGEIELGASAIAGIYYLMIFMLGQGFSIGAQIITARRNGEGNYQKIGSVIYQGIAFLLIMAVMVILASQKYSALILGKIISSPQILAAALDYLEYRIYGLLFAFVIVMFRAFYVGIIKTQVLTWNSLVMLFANVILDYIFIFGKFGFPALGIQGAAIASVISEALSTAFFFLYTIIKVDAVKYGLNRLLFWQTKILKEILELSIWTMLQSFISIATWFLFFVAIEHLSEKALAISNILRSISSLPFMIMAALGAAANSITGNLIGGARDEEVLPTAYKIIRMGYIIGLACELIMLIFPYYTMRIYTDNQQLIVESTPAFYVMLTIYLSLVPGMVLFNVVSGSGHTKTALYMELVSMVFYGASIWYVVFYLRADIAWCWTTEHAYNIVLFLLAYYYLRKKQWCCKII